MFGDWNRKAILLSQNSCSKIEKTSQLMETKKLNEFYYHFTDIKGIFEFFFEKNVIEKRY